MVIQPGLKGSEVFLKINDHPGIVDGGVDLQSISDDAGVVEQALAIDLGERRDPTDIETGVRFPEGLLFFENGRPAKPSLVDLQKQTAEEFMVVGDRKAIGRVVVNAVKVAGFHAADGFAVGGWFFHGRRGRGYRG